VIQVFVLLCFVLFFIWRTPVRLRCPSVVSKMSFHYQTSVTAVFIATALLTRDLVVSRGGRIVDVVLEWEWESNLGLRLGGEGLLTPINNSFVEHRVYWE